MVNLALIPARAGSKGIPDKNIKDFNGNPLIYWTIKTAFDSKCFNRVIVSTDSIAIADTAKKYGAEVPFIRKQELATDNSTVMEVALDLIQYVEKQNYQFDIITVLQPTSPLRDVDDILTAKTLMSENDTQAIVSVSPSPIHPQYIKKIDKNGFLRFYNETQKKVARRQDMDPVYHDNGSIYMIRRKVLTSQKTWFPSKTVPLVIPNERSVDIDTPKDFKDAEFRFRQIFPHAH